MLGGGVWFLFFSFHLDVSFFFISFLNIILLPSMVNMFVNLCCMFVLEVSVLKREFALWQYRASTDIHPAAHSFRAKSKIRVLADAVLKENASRLIYSHLLILFSQRARGLILYCMGFSPLCSKLYL